MKALVLSGGGSKGSYQVGVWKALRKLNVKYDIITGTSVGALNGAIMVQNDYFKALKIWKKLNLQVLFGEDAAPSTNNFDVYKMYGEEFLKNGGIDATRLENLIKETINLRKFYNSNIDFGLITYNLTTNKPLSITKKEIKPEKITDYLMASASCFPAFKKKDIDGEKYIDGGYYDALPINLAIDMGADEIIAVDLNAPGLKKALKKKVKITYIKPKNKLTSFLNFYEQGNASNMKFGYNDTMKVFKRLEGNHYTFKLGTLKKTIKLYKNTYSHITNKILKYKKVIKSVEDLTGLTINFENESIKELEEKLFSKLMEDIAKEFAIDPTKIYTQSTFNKALKKKLKIYLKAEIKTATPCPKEEVQLYKLIKKRDYATLRKEAVLNPLELLRAIYLYTICEA